MALFGNGYGHACPVEGIVYVARHSIHQTNESPMFFTWEDSTGKKGKAQPGAYSYYLDIGKLVLIQGDTPHYYKKASSLPEVGETIHWVEFKRKNMLDEVRKARVKYYRAGYAYFDKPPNIGASGSCLFNEEWEVVGIVVWRIQKGSGQGAASLLDWL